MNYTTTLKKSVKSIALLLILVLLGAGVLFIFGRMPAAERLSLLLDVAKVLLQIITLLLVAGFVSKLVRSFDKDRKADKALSDFRSGILDDLEALFRKIKTSQHLMRRAGLTYAFKVQITTMNQDHVKIYGTEMNKLSEVRLDLERIQLGIERFSGSFTKGSDLKGRLDQMGSYLDELLTEYERLWPKLNDGSDTQFGNYLTLIDFTGGSDSRYASTFAIPYGNAISLMREDLLPLKLALQDGASSSEKSLTNGQE